MYPSACKCLSTYQGHGGCGCLSCHLPSDRWLSRQWEAVSNCISSICKAYIILPWGKSHPDALLFCIIFLHSSNAGIEVWYTPRLTCQSNFYCRELKLKLIYLYVPLFKSMDIKWLTTSDFCLKNMVKICNNQWSSKKTNPGRQDLKFKTCWSC